MSNIMLTSVCNLHCPYCFANEFVNRSTCEISMDHFRKALDFILADGTERSVGLIGGEPTTHSHFEELLRIALNDQRLNVVSLYTNAILLDRFMPLMSHSKMRLLVNCNSPSDIGNMRFQKMEANLDELILNRLCRNQVTLGINIYKLDFEYSYILMLLKRYQFDHVRVSVTVPNMNELRNRDAHKSFLEIKPGLLEFFHVLLDHGILPSFDCNKMPVCLLTEEDKNDFDKYVPQLRKTGLLKKTNVFSPEVTCNPVVDIMQDLTAVRCFGLSEYTKQHISQFRGIRELKQFYRRTIDAYACNTSYSPDCAGCYNRMTNACYGGCLAYKINDILRIQRFSEEIMPSCNLYPDEN